MLKESSLLNRALVNRNSCNNPFQKGMMFLMSFLICFNLLAQQPTMSANDKTAALFQAIRSASTEQLQQQLSNGADANDSLNSYSAMMAAALNGSVEQMKILIAHGANVNYQSSDGTTALWLAVPDWDKTKLLLDNGADVNHKIGGYGILVKLAAIPGSLKLFHLLISKGADVKQSAPDNYLVYNAAMSGDTSILGFLLRSGFNANDSVSFGDYPINNALAFRTFSTLKMLVDNGANVNVHQWVPQGLDAFKGFTPLMFAAVAHDKLSFMYLIDHGADVNAKDKHGETPLILLQQSETDDPEMTLALLKHGARASDKAIDGTDALYYAEEKGNTSSVAILQKYVTK